MNAYTTMGQARIRHHEVATILRTQGVRAGAFLGALERQRGWQADAEQDWLLTREGRKPPPYAPCASLLRQAIGEALIRVGQRLAGTSAEGFTPVTALAVGVPGTTG
jgi:hypothetical protein